MSVQAVKGTSAMSGTVHGHGDRLVAVGQGVGDPVVVHPAEQGFRVVEAGGLGRRPQHDGVQVAVAAVAGPGEGLARGLGVAGLHAAGPLVGAEQQVGGDEVDGDGLAPGAVHRDLGPLLAHDGAEGVVFHGIGAHEGHVVGRGVHLVVVIADVEPVGVGEQGVLHAQLGGLGLEGLDILCAVKKETGLPIVTELMDVTHLPLFKDVDVIQIGARNMQNFDLLKQLGRLDRPILLKRGLNATYEEWIMAAEYIMASGNENVILCERGIRTFESYTRNTLDLQSIPVLRKLTHLPIIVDPSHAGGKWWLVEPMAKASVAAGADGLMIEVHNNPECALCDGAQSLKPQKYDVLLKEVLQIAKVIGKNI